MKILAIIFFCVLVIVVIIAMTVFINQVIKDIRTGFDREKQELDKKLKNWDK